VGHQEREATITVLRTAAQEGRLTPEELAQRIGTALEARTFADLDALVADLPVAPISTGLRRAATFDVSRIGADPDHRLRMSGGMSSHVQRGVWSVPPFLALSAGPGSVKLDFQQAVCAHEVVDIAVSGGVGTIVLMPGDGAPTATGSAGGWAARPTRSMRSPGTAVRRWCCTGARRWARSSCATPTGSTDGG